ncbi:MAG: YARHG domain-containing protein [Alphaproteobacteria bacterium]|nr:YARHG domain-containing protein [Alphaproteobacteria bacterium]
MLLPLLMSLPALGAPRYTDQPTASTDQGREIAEIADDFLDGRRRRTYSDCSGLVYASFEAAGVEPNVRASSADLWDQAQADGRIHFDQPAPGDIAFFDDTYDKDRDGRVNDPRTHVAIVVDVHDDGTIEMINAGVSQGTARLYMNLHSPDVRSEDGRDLNSYLGVSGYGPDDRDRLAGQLWAGFAHPPGAEPEPLLAAAPPRPPPRKTPSVASSSEDGGWSPGESTVQASLSVAPTPEPPPSRRASRRQARKDVEHAGPTGAPSLTPLEQTLAGYPLSVWDLTSAGCDELWALRNTVFARHGYTFSTDRAVDHFTAQPWYHADRRLQGVNPNTYLTDADQQNVTLLVALEKDRGCR